ncbi:MAG: hypothetical protein NT154_41880 [Verrucomicrobia bacterium]|nr:hypothetical protein [Verrucomicrobiota bacterium]
MNAKILLASYALCALSVAAQNLIVNGDFEAGNISFGNDYLYSPADMQPAGTYCVVANPSLVHYAWASFGDHTTGTGLMLVANGDSSPTNVIWRQIVNVAPNGAYLFSGWAASSHPENPGRFFLFVNGVQQGSVVDLPSTTEVWQNYSAIWSSGASVSALLEIRMLTTAYEGNDFVLDDLSFRRVSVVAPPRLSIQRATAAAAVVLSWPSVTNQIYEIQWSPVLETNQWFSLGAPVPGTGGTASVTDAIVGQAQRFYRLLALD